jgi:hypothetical protein
MSLINRVVFFHRKNDKLALLPWAVVETSLGQMVEPLTFNRFNPDGTAFDIDDEMSLISDAKIVDLNQLMGKPPFADDTGTSLHGGILNPRTGF